MSGGKLIDPQSIRRPRPQWPLRRRRWLQFALAAFAALAGGQAWRRRGAAPAKMTVTAACTGCTACELACPNATIKIVTKMEVLPDGKKKKALDTFVYHLELCTMCNLCIEACPTGAIKMAQTFEHSVFDRSQLTKKLNAPGSKLMEGVE